MKKVKLFIISFLMFVKYTYSINDIEVRLIGIRIKTGKDHARYIHKVQKDQFVMFYQIRSKKMELQKIKIINHILSIYKYNLDFEFFQTSYHDVYYYATFEPRNTNLMISYIQRHNEEYLYDSNYLSKLNLRFNEYRTNIMKVYNIDSIANTWNDTFYISKSIPLNQFSVLTDNVKLAMVFNKRFHPTYWDDEKKERFELPIETDSIGIHILKDSFIFIYNSEFSTLVKLHYNSYRFNYPNPLSLYDEIADSLKKDYLYELMNYFYFKPIGATYYGEGNLCTSIDMFPMLVFLNRDIFKRFTFLFHQSNSLYSPFKYFDERHEISLEYLEPYLKSNSILHEIKKIYPKQK